MSNRHLSYVLINCSESHILGIQILTNEIVADKLCTHPHPQQFHWSKFEFQAHDFPNSLYVTLTYGTYVLLTTPIVCTQHLLD